MGRVSDKEADIAAGINLGDSGSSSCAKQVLRDYPKESDGDKRRKIDKQHLQSE